MNNTNFKTRLYEIRRKLGEIKRRKNLKITKTESVEEFVKRGGEITYLTDSKDLYTFKTGYINKLSSADAYDYLYEPMNVSEVI